MGILNGWEKEIRSILFDAWARDREYAYLDLRDGAGDVPALKLLTEVRPLTLLVQVHLPASTRFIVLLGAQLKLQSPTRSDTEYCNEEGGSRR